MFTSSTERGDCSFSWIIINRSGEPDVWPNHHILQKPGFPWNRGIYRNPSYLLRCLQTRVFGRELISPDWFTVSIHYSSNLFWGTEDRNLPQNRLKNIHRFFFCKSCIPYAPWDWNIYLHFIFNIWSIWVSVCHNFFPFGWCFVFLNCRFKDLNFKDFNTFPWNCSD